MLIDRTVRESTGTPDHAIYSYCDHATPCEGTGRRRRRRAPARPRGGGFSCFIRDLNCRNRPRNCRDTTRHAVEHDTPQPEHAVRSTLLPRTTVHVTRRPILEICKSTVTLYTREALIIERACASSTRCSDETSRKPNRLHRRERAEMGQLG